VAQRLQQPASQARYLGGVVDRRGARATASLRANGHRWRHGSWWHVSRRRSTRRTVHAVAVAVAVGAAADVDDGGHDGGVGGGTQCLEAASRLRHVSAEERPQPVLHTVRACGLRLLQQHRG
jgi:hypothetical protein